MERDTPFCGLQEQASTSECESLTVRAIGPKASGDTRRRNACQLPVRAYVPVMLYPAQPCLVHLDWWVSCLRSHHWCSIIITLWDTIWAMSTHRPAAAQLLPLFSKIHRCVCVHATAGPLVCVVVCACGTTPVDTDLLRAVLLCEGASTCVRVGGARCSLSGRVVHNWLFGQDKEEAKP
jgi:hypothetical protein